MNFNEQPPPRREKAFFLNMEILRLSLLVLFHLSNDLNHGLDVEKLLVCEITVNY